MAIGRPISLTPNIATKNISSLATADQTEFTVTGGYRINEIAVYRNGVRLAEGRDFTASDGDTVTLVNAASTSDVIEFAVFDSFNVSDAIVSAASSQNLNGDFNVTGILYAGDFKTSGLTLGISTVSSSLHVGSALTANAAGDVESIGIITAASFSGDGSSLTGIAVTANIVSVAITTKDINVSAAATITGAVNIDATTDSTSTSTGALIVDGGLGVAKNVYIGAGLSVAGTLTYEDVTSVDSVGLITAKSGVNITGGQLTVGSGITMGIAGVATFSGTADVHLHDNVKLLAGDSSDLSVYHSGAQGVINNSTGNLSLQSSGNIWIENQAGSKVYIKTIADQQVEAYYNNSKKFETTNDGVSITGICTATDFSGASGGAADFPNGLTGTTGTFTGDINLSGTASGVSSATWDASANSLIFKDDSYANFGDGSDLKIYHQSDYPRNVIESSGADFVILTSAPSGTNEKGLSIGRNGAVQIFYDNSSKLATTNEGIQVTGFTSTTAGLGVTGGMWEGSFIKAGKLTDNKTLGISTSNIFVFTTQETTTGTPNIIWNDSYALSSKMKVGDSVTVTVITTAAAGGYCANWTIDGNAVSEQWNGGSAPAAGGADGYDVYTHTLVRKATGTGDTGWLMFSNVSNFT